MNVSQKFCCLATSNQWLESLARCFKLWTRHRTIIVLNALHVLLAVQRVRRNVLHVCSVTRAISSAGRWVLALELLAAVHVFLLEVQMQGPSFRVCFGSSRVLP